MALTLRGSGQVSADNYGIDSDGSITATGKSFIKNNNSYATSSQTSYDNASLRLDNLTGGSSIGTSFGVITPNVNYIQSGYNEGTTAPLTLNPYGGYVTTPKQPSFCAYDIQTSSGDIIYGSTWHNEGNHFNTTTGVFTAPITGVYHFSFSALMGNPITTSHYTRLLWKINGSNNTRYGDTLDDRNKSAVNASGNAEYWPNQLSLTFKLSANDTITVYNGGSQKVYGAQYGHFCGHLVG
jgi:hypothetical protein